MSYQSTVATIRNSTDKQVLEAWRQYGLGRITQPQFVQLAAAIIARANGAAVAVADLALSAELLRVTGATHSPVGMLPLAYDQPRLEKGVTSLLADAKAGGDITDRLTRFARTEPLTAANDAYSRAVSTSAPVTGWVRQMDGDPCQLCRWWWREGRVWPSSYAMPHHKGCDCTQRIVVADTIREVAR